MRSIKKINSFLPVILIALISCGRNNLSGSQEKEYENSFISASEDVRDITESLKLMTDSILNGMTLEERVGQCFMPAINSESDEYTLKIFKKYIEDNHIGGIVLMNGFPEAAATIAELGSKSDVPLFVAIDAEWGLGMRLKGGSIFPRNGRISGNTDEIILYEYGREIARECKELGINMVLGPVVDITGVYTGVIGSRSFGSDPHKVANWGIAYAKGLESAGVVSVAKHFPGHGSSVADSHYGVVRVKRKLNELDSIDFFPFKEYIKSGLNGIMVGHIDVPALDDRGLPAPVSPLILNDLLREEMGFKGLIITDAFNMGGARGFGGWEALQAGADIVLCPPDVKKETKIVLEKIINGEFDERIINERCRNIIFTKLLFGLWYKNGFENSISGMEASEIANKLKGI